MKNNSNFQSIKAFETSNGHINVATFVYVSNTNIRSSSLLGMVVSDPLQGKRFRSITFYHICPIVSNFPSVCPSQCHLSTYWINVREYRRGNQNCKRIQRNWHYRGHKTKKIKIKTQHNMCWTPLYVNKHK